MEELTLALDMGKDGLADLNAAQLLFADLADDVTRIDFNAVQKFYRVVPPVDKLNYKAVPILIQIAGVVVKIEPDADPHRLFADPRCTLVIKLQRCRRVCFGKIDALQIDIAFGRRTARFGDAFDGDLLHQPLVISLHRVQPINHIVDAVRLMRSGVTQRQKRTKLFQPFLCLRSFDRLRLVNNKDRICFGDNVNGAAGTELVQLHINAASVFPFGVERLRIDDHHVDGTIRSKAVDLGQLRGIIDKEANLLSVFLGKMLLRHLKGLIHALADGDTRHHDDELAPAVVLVQFVHGLDVSISFADARLHFDGQVVVSFQLFRRLDLICPLHLLQMFQNDFVGKFRHDTLVAPAGKIFFVRNRLLIPSASVHEISGREVWLPCKHVHDGFGGVCLEFLVLELKF